MNLAEMSGLDLMRVGVSLPGNMGDQGIASVIPMKIIEADEGRVVFLATADARHTNPLGSVHGGFAATVLDSATGCAVHTLLPAGVGFGTVDLNVKMIRPVPFEQQMRAVIRGFTDEDTTLAGLPSAQGPHPVATIFGFPNTVEVGAGAVPAWMITGVGVAPTHRRRGILRRMMEPELARARSEGCGMAALTVSEGEIRSKMDELASIAREQIRSGE